ncbi:hypothetical protein [Pedobacter sp. L105]|uniref:hypothetical protein n=1 Tax=Pedobacter sp. L105 TaxID=1641871 RepID=UPI00131BDC02|nr:hypothetical protein [Pedobacter sp. L105]
MAIKSGKVKQTEKTKKCSTVYSLAIQLSSDIKTQFSERLHKFQDGTMHNRMNSEISKILYDSRDGEETKFEFTENSFDGLSNFEFNTNSKLIDFLRVKPSVNLTGNNLVVSLPELKIPAKLKFIPESKFCKLNVYVALLRLNNPKPKAVKSQSVLVDINQGILNAHKFQFKVPDGCVCLVGVFLDYFYILEEYKVLLNNKDFNPSAICAAIFTPNVLDENGKFIYSKD